MASILGTFVDLDTAYRTAGQLADDNNIAVDLWTNGKDYVATIGNPDDLPDAYEHDGTFEPAYWGVD